MTDCPFCIRIAKAELIMGNKLAVAVHDGYPISPGHSLIVPRRHVADLLGLTQEEQAAIWALVAPVRQNIEKDHSPDGYNIGVNIGAAGGSSSSGLRSAACSIVPLAYPIRQKQNLQIHSAAND